MPTGKYKRTTYHKNRQKEGWAKSGYKHTPEHKAKIAASVKKSWEYKKKGIKVCSCCGRPFKD